MFNGLKLFIYLSPIKIMYSIGNLTITKCSTFNNLIISFSFVIVYLSKCYCMRGYLFVCLFLGFVREITSTLN